MIGMNTYSQWPLQREAMPHLEVGNCFRAGTIESLAPHPGGSRVAGARLWKQWKIRNDPQQRKKRLHIFVDWITYYISFLDWLRNAIDFAVSIDVFLMVGFGDVAFCDCSVHETPAVFQISRWSQVTSLPMVKVCIQQQPLEQPPAEPQQNHLSSSRTFSPRSQHVGLAGPFTRGSATGSLRIPFTVGHLFSATGRASAGVLNGTSVRTPTWGGICGVTIGSVFLQLLFCRIPPTDHRAYKQLTHFRSTKNKVK